MKSNIIRKGNYNILQHMRLAVLPFFYALIWATPSFGDYSNHNDGTVTDNNTSLMWQQVNDNIDRNWDTAMTYCENLSLAEYNDWRLPNVKELESIVDESRYNPSVDTTVFPNTFIDYFYWSSTTYVYNSGMAWYVAFYYGEVGSAQKSYNVHVRCVRGGY